MTDDGYKIEGMKIKLKSATKLKTNIEKNLCQTRMKERSMNEKLSTVKADIEFLKEQLEDLKTQIAHARHQISMVEICSTSEKTKIEGQFGYLESHKKGFQELFDKERKLFDIRMKEVHEKEAQEEELLRQKEIEMAKKSEEEAREAAAIEAECEALERECTVLRKRNNAIMLQLRRKLLETENARRKLAKTIKC